MTAGGSAENKDLIRRAFEHGPFCEIGQAQGGEALGSRKASVDPYAPGCAFHGAAELFRSAAPSRDYVRAFPNLRLTIDDMIAEGDRVVTHLTGRGTHAAEFRGVPPSGEEVTMRVIVINQFEAGRIVEEWGTLTWE